MRKNLFTEFKNLQIFKFDSVISTETNIKNFSFACNDQIFHNLFIKLKNDLMKKYYFEQNKSTKKIIKILLQTNYHNKIYNSQLSMFKQISTFINTITKPNLSKLLRNLRGNEKGIKSRIVRSIYLALETKGNNKLKKLFYKWKFLQPIQKNKLNDNFILFERKFFSYFVNLNGRKFIKNLNLLKVKMSKKKQLNQVSNLFRNKLIRQSIKSRLNYLRKFILSKWLKIWYVKIIRISGSLDENKGVSLINGLRLINNITKISNSLQKLYSPLIRNSISSSFLKIRNFNSKNYKVSQINKIITKFLFRIKNNKHYFTKWKSKSTGLKIKSLKMFSLRLLYSKIKDKLITTIKRERFKNWNNKPSSKIIKSKHSNQTNIDEIVNLESIDLNGIEELKAFRNFNKKENKNIMISKNSDFIKVINLKEAFSKSINDLGKLCYKHKLIEFLSIMKNKSLIKSLLFKILALKFKKLNSNFKISNLRKWKKKIDYRHKFGLFIKSNNIKNNDKINSIKWKKLQLWRERSIVNQLVNSKSCVSARLILSINKFHLKRRIVEIMIKTFNKFKNSLYNRKNSCIDGIIRLIKLYFRIEFKNLFVNLRKKLCFNNKLLYLVKMKFILSVRRFYKVWKNLNKYLYKLKALLLRKLILSNEKATVIQYFKRFDIKKSSLKEYLKINLATYKLIKYYHKFFFSKIINLREKKKIFEKFLKSLNKKLFQFYFKNLIIHQSLVIKKNFIRQFTGYTKLINLSYSIFFKKIRTRKNFREKKYKLRFLILALSKRSLNYYFNKFNKKLPLKFYINCNTFNSSISKFSKKIFFDWIKNLFNKRTKIIELGSKIRFKILKNSFDKVKFIKTNVSIINYIYGFQKIERILGRKFLYNMRECRYKENKKEKMRKILIKRESKFLPLMKFLKIWQKFSNKKYVKFIKALNIKKFIKYYRKKILSSTLRKFKNKALINPLKILVNVHQIIKRINRFLLFKNYLHFSLKIKQKSSKKLPKSLTNKYYPKIILLNKLFLKIIFRILVRNQKKTGLYRKIKKLMISNRIKLMFNLLRYINIWRKIASNLKNSCIKSKFKAKLFKTLYSFKNKNLSARKYYLSWKDIVFPKIKTKFYILAKKITKFSLINNEKNNLKNGLRRWISRIFKFDSRKGFYSKYRILKKLLVKKQDKNEEYRKFGIRLTMLRWKLFYNSTHDNKMNNVRLGNVFLQQIIRRKYLEIIKTSVSIRFDPNLRRLMYLRHVILKCYEKFCNLIPLFNRWRYQYILNTDLDASVLKCKNLEINFDKPSSGILEKLKKLNENKLRRTNVVTETEVNQIKYNAKAEKRSKNTNKVYQNLVIKLNYFLSVKFNIWRKFALKQTIISSTKIIQEFFNIHFKLNNNIIEKKRLLKRRQQKFIINSQAYLRNMFYLKLIVKIKRFIYTIQNKKIRHLNAYFKKWVRGNKKEKNEKSSKIIQKFVRHKVKKYRVKTIYTKLFKTNRIKKLQKYFKYWEIMMRRKCTERKNINKIINFIRLSQAKRNFKIKRKKLLCSIKLRKLILIKTLIKKDYLTSYFNRLKIKTSIFKIKRYAQIIQKFIVSKINKRIRLKKHRNNFMNCLLYNYHRIFTKFLLNRYLNLWTKVRDNHKMNIDIFTRFIYSLFKKYFLRSFRKFSIYPAITKFEKWIKSPIFKTLLNRMKFQSVQFIINNEKNKKLIEQKLLFRISQELAKKLNLRIKQVIMFWKTCCNNYLLTRKAKIIQDFYRSKKKSELAKIEKEKNKKVYRKKVSMITSEMKIKLSYLTLSQGEKFKNHDLTNSMIKWKEKAIKNTVLKSKFDKSSCKINSYLKNLFKRLEEKIISKFCLFMSIWFSKANKILFNEKSSFIQRFSRKKVHLKKQKRSHNGILQKATNYRKLVCQTLILFSKFYRNNFVIEKFYKNYFLRQLKYQRKNFIKENLSEYFSKLVKKFRNQLLIKMKILSKQMKFNIVIYNYFKRKIYHYLIYFTRNLMFWKMSCLKSNRTFIQKFTFLSKIYKINRIISLIFKNRHLSDATKSFFIKKNEIFDLFMKIFKKYNKIKRIEINQIANLIEKKRKISTKLSIMFKTKFNKIYSKNIHNLLKFLKYTTSKKIKESYIKKNYFKNLITSLKNTISLIKIQQFYISKSSQIASKLISKFLKIYKTCYFIKRPFIKQHFLKILKFSFQIKISSVLDNFNMKIRKEKLIELRKFLETFKKHIDYFKCLIFAKHKDLIMSPMNMKTVSLKLRKKNINDLITFMKMNKICKGLTKVIKKNIFNKMSHHKYIPKLTKYLYDNSIIISKFQIKKFINFYKTLQIQNKIKHLLIKNIFRNIVITRVSDKKMINSLTHMTKRIKKSVLRLIFKKIVLVDDLSKTRKSLSQLTFTIKKLLIKVIIENLYKSRDFNNHVKNISILKEVLKKINLKYMLKNHNLFEEMNQKLKKMLKIKGKIRKVIFLKIVKYVNVLPELKEKLRLNINRFYRKINSIFLKKIQLNFKILKKLNESIKTKCICFDSILKKAILKNFLRYKLRNIEKNEQMKTLISNFCLIIKKGIFKSLSKSIIKRKQEIQKTINNLQQFNNRIKYGILKTIVKNQNKIEDINEKTRITIRRVISKIKVACLSKIFDNINRINEIKKSDKIVETKLFYKFQIIQLHLREIIKKLIKKIESISNKNLILSNHIKIWRSYNYFLINFIKKKQILEKTKFESIYIQWKRNTNMIHSISTANTIKKFLMKRLLIRKNKVFEMKQNLIEMKIRGFLKLASIVRKLPFKEGFRKIKNEMKRRVLISFLLLLKCKKNSYIKKFMLNFKKTFKTKNKKFTQSVNKIILIYRNRKFRKNFQKFQLKIRIIKELLNIKNNKLRNKLVNSMNIWKRNMNAIRFVKFIEYTQKFLRKKLNQVYLKKNNKRIIIHNMLKEYLVLRKIKPYFKEFVKSIRFIRAYNSLLKFMYKRLINKSNKHQKCNIISNFDTVMKLYRNFNPKILKFKYSFSSKKQKYSLVKKTRNKK